MTTEMKPERKKRARRGRGEGGVYQRESDGLWVGTVSLGFDGNGKRKRCTVYGKTKKEAMDKLHEAQGKATNGMLPTSTKMTIAQFLDLWLESVKPSVSPGTHAAYEQHARNLIKPRMGGVRLDAIKPLHVSTLYTRLAADGFSTAMQKKAGVTLRSALSWAVAVAGLIHDNPVKRVKMPVHKPPEVQALEAEQLAAFLAAAKSDRLYAMYVLAVDSGCRQGELLALTWDDLDLERGTVSVTKSLEEVKGNLRIKEPKSAKGRRTVSLSSFTVAAMKQHLQAMVTEKSYRRDGQVFCGSRNKSWLRKSDVYRHSFAPILKAASLSFKFHALRHSCATFLFSAGADVKTVQERLGHSTPVMTLNTYSHVLEGAQAEAARKLDAILTVAGRERPAGETRLATDRLQNGDSASGSGEADVVAKA